MNIKIEPGANVQITDKPIINVYGDIVQHKEEHIHYDAKSRSSSGSDEAVADVKDKEQNMDDLVSKLKPIFYNNEDNVRRFIKEIRGMKDKDITDLVNAWVKEQLISDYGNSRKGELWLILNDAGLYKKSRQNWNRRVF